MEEELSKPIQETIAVSIVLLFCVLAIFGSDRALTGPWVGAAQAVGIVLGGVCLVLLGVLIRRVRQ